MKHLIRIYPRPEILHLEFAMKPVHLDRKTDPEQLAVWRAAADAVLARLDAGRDVAFPTLGDVGLYSTAFYLLTLIKDERPEVKVRIVPGITAMSACSAKQIQIRPKR